MQDSEITQDSTTFTFENNLAIFAMAKKIHDENSIEIGLRHDRYFLPIKG